MTIYVAGFLFSEDRQEVLLIRKLRPEWQAGKWNGIGGKVEEGEAVSLAMVREFREETGLRIKNWIPFASLYDGRGWSVRFFYAADDKIFEAISVTDELVDRFQVEHLPENVIPNLRWLIPMALSMKDERCGWFRVTEEAEC